jgi:hypothetical protein
MKKKTSHATAEMFYSKDAEGQVMSQDENEEDTEPIIGEDNNDDENDRQSMERKNKLNHHGSNRSQK